MTIDYEICQNLVNILASVASSAYGECSETPEGIQAIENYSRQKFLEIVNEWETKMGEPWTVTFEVGAGGNPLKPIMERLSKR